MSTIIYIAGILAFLSNTIIPFIVIIALFTIFCALKKIIPLKICLLIYLLFFLGFFNTSFHSNKNDYLGRAKHLNNAILQGRIVSVPQTSLNKTRLKFYFEPESVNHIEITPSKTIVVINGENGNFGNLKIGDIASLKGNLREPSPASNPSQFDYSKYLKNKNVFSVFYVKNNEYKILHSPTFSFNKGISNAWWATLRNLDITRDKIIAKHAKYVPSPMLEVLGGIVFGDDAVNPPDDIKEVFINSGLLHLLAASGLNVGIIFFMWYWLATRFGLGFKPTIATSAVLILLYTFMTGFPPSIVRATIMILFVLFGKLIHRQANTIALVFLVGLLMLLFDPLMLLDVGFELSFLVTIGLILCVEPIVNIFKNKELAFQNKHQKAHPYLKKILHFISPAYLIGLVAVPLVAQLWVAPLQMYYFNTFTPYSILANIIVVPFVAIISFLGFSGSVLSLIPFVSDFILKITDFSVLPFTRALVTISGYFAGLPSAIIYMPSPSILQIFLYYILVLAFVKALTLKFKNKKSICIFLAIFLVFLFSFIKFPNKNFEFISFSVGNADSFLIKTPKNNYIMIDTGRLPYRGTSSAKMIMEEYFRDNSIKKLDLLILTHFDDDHSGGTLDILKNTKVDKIIIREKHCDTKASCKILNYFDFKEINAEIAQSGKIVYNKDGVKITTYFTDFNGRKFENENSIIALIEFEDKKLLFMGDSGVLAYEKFKNILPENIDILKIGHHGARNVLNKEMLEKLNPKYAVISTGVNLYGHPSEETLDLLEFYSIPTFLTQNLGAIKFVFKDGKIIPTHFDGKKMIEIADKKSATFLSNATEKFFKYYDKKIKAEP